MKSRLLAAALLACAPAYAAAQEPEGFQQDVDYRIEARLDEATDVLSARARLRYTNRSPAVLDTLWFHQHLNAFRPNSLWAQRELRFGERRFQDLGPEEHAFERLTGVTVNGTAVRPVYPLAPDSTVVALPLPSPLRPGETARVLLDWDARLATTPRRQARRGRHFDWAQWYPRIAVYEHTGWQVQPLLPQGEFYGEFGSFDVTLDVPADQVIGSTGVPVEGDPGWRAAAAPNVQELYVRRDAYADEPAEPLGLLQGAADADRKRVRWRAQDVHHFAWTHSPDYVYEQGRLRDIAIHVLYQQGDTAWDDNVAVDRTIRALRFVEDLFGPYPWPQLTNAHRIEPGGTEFPMLIMDGSASEGLIVHEVTHQYLHGILASNEWKQGWMDEGFTSFVTNWYFEEQGAQNVWDRTLDRLAELERRMVLQPIATPGAEFRTPQLYTLLTYTKASAVFYMLRELVGEQTMREILRTYYDEKRLQRVSAADFERIAERVSGRDLDWFFDQWFRSSATLDYGIGSATTERLPDGRWRTRVVVHRQGEAWMPVTLELAGETRELDTRRRLQVLEVITERRPERVVLDPARELLDIDRSNNVVEL